MANHMIVGLGGTGGSIIRAFRKLIFQRYREQDPASLKVRYLYVDSSDEMMAHNDPTWKILGTSVQLSRRSQLLIRGLNLSEVVDNLNSYPGIAPWLGSRDQFRSIINSADAANIFGGQKRRLGRFLFACRVSDFRRQLQELVREMAVGASTNTVFHVVCGLAGGTGSGSVIDVVAQIRDMYPDSVNFKTLIYALLPEKDPKPDKAGPNYHANGYAALMELNALAVASYQPFNVAAQHSDRMQLQDPFNCCYLFTDENEAGSRVDIDKELPTIAAGFLFEKIVAAQNFTWDSLRRQETFEVGSQAKEPETSPGTGRPERCRLFFSFGVKQIAYPEEEIRERLTYQFARQATLQLRFNRWSDSMGYIDEPANQSFSEFVKRKDVLENWRLTDEHLTLSIGVLPDEIANKRWKPVAAFWNDLLPNFKTHIRETFKDKRGWADELAKLCETAFAQNYRDLGVQKFYETKLGDLRDHVREVRRRIEIELFSDWKNGARSMNDIDRLIQALAATLDERWSATDDKLARTREAEAKAEEKVVMNRREWAKIGPISELLRKRDQIFDALAESLAELYIQRTRTYSWNFGKKMLEALKAELASLAGEVSISAKMISEATDAFKKAADARCADQGSADRTKQVVRFYNPDLVRTVEAHLTRDKATQTKQTAAVRDVLANIVGEDQRFSTFNQRVSPEQLTDALVSTCETSATAAHNDLISSDPTFTRVLRVNVIEKLYREFNSNHEELRTFVLDVVNRARSFLPLKDSEVARTGPGIPSTSKVSFLTVIMPDAPELKAFRELLQNEFKDAHAGNKEMITNPATVNEITLVDVTNVLPARFVRDVEFLRARYELRTTSARASLELHSEGDGSQFPSLYVRTVGPEDVLPYILIANAMNLVRSIPDSATGIESIHLIIQKGRREEAIPLGATVDEAVNNADESVLDRLELLVMDKLGTDYLHKTKREELLENIQNQVEEVNARFKNPTHKTYKAYCAAADKAEALLIPQAAKEAYAQ